MNKTRENKAMGGGLKSVSENHIAIAMGNMMDDEGSMVLDQLDQLERACGMIRSYIGKDYEKQLPAWVQSKITLATDYIDKVSNYLVSNNEKKKGVISALEGIKSKIDGLISESSEDDELRYHDCRELGEDSWPEYDAQGIYLCRVCKKCKKAKLSKYRKKILSGYGQSDVDEPIEETVKLTQEGTENLMKKLSKEQAAIIGAYTGYTAGPLSEMYEYIDKIIGRSLNTLERLRLSQKGEIKQKSKADFLAICRPDVDEPIEETVKLTQEGTKHIRKDCKTLKRAEAYQDRLYDIYDKVKLLKSPKYSEDGEYVWEVGGKLLTREPNDPMTIRRQPNPNLLDYADE